MRWPWSRLSGSGEGAWGPGRPPPADGAGTSPPAPDDAAGQLRAALREIDDPELGIDIVSLGIVRQVEVEGAHATVVLAPTSPSCPVGPWMIDQVRDLLSARFPALARVDVSLTWDPPWSPDQMSAEARLALGHD